MKEWSEDESEDEAAAPAQSVGSVREHFEALAVADPPPAGRRRQNAHGA